MESRRKSWIAALLLLACAAPALARADEGMWPFHRPPREILRERYGFEPPEGWFEHLQKASVRFSTGGSGSIVSPRGLVMTNHHVASDVLEQLSTPERNLIQTGFLARTPEEELPAPNLEVLALQSTADVTDEVNAAADPAMGAAEANAARRKRMAQIEERAEAETGLDCEVVALYQGGRYHLYSYERYTDVRLVMAPEGQIAFFGGDNDNFEFPRWCLDVTFFRIWKDGRPLEPEHWLRWSDVGAAAGDLVFVSGHPGSTQRLYTVDHLKYLRDVRYPQALRSIWRREVKLQNWAARGAENARKAHGDLFGIKNARKAYTGTLAGLQDPDLFARKAAQEGELRAKIERTPTAEAMWGDAWAKVAAAEQTAAGLYPRFLALGGRGLSLGSDLFGIAVDLVRLAGERPRPSAERLREYRDSELDSLFLNLYSPAPIHAELEVERLHMALSFMMEVLGGDDPAVLVAMDGRSPREMAEQAVAGTSLASVEARRRLAEGGLEAIEASEDPMIALARRLDGPSRELRKRWEDEVESVEREAYAKIAAARFEIEGEDVYPDATFTLRLAFGTVAGWEEGGREVEPFTTFAGLYEKAAQRDEPDYDLPASWIEAKDSLDLATPFDFVCTADIVGGNSGSPVVDREGEVVGLIFDGNVHSLILNIAYTDVQARAVSVDARAIALALRKVYGAAALADELTGGEGG